MVRDYYALLEVSPKASHEVISAAYRAKAKQLHPDAVPPEQREWATEQFQALTEAYEVLSDPERRAQYDAAVSSPPDSKDDIVKQALEPDPLRRWAWIVLGMAAILFVITAALKQGSPGVQATVANPPTNLQTSPTPVATPQVPPRSGDLTVQHVEGSYESWGAFNASGTLRNESNYAAIVQRVTVEGYNSNGELVFSQATTLIDGGRLVIVSGSTGYELEPGESAGYSVMEPSPPKGIKTLKAVPTVTYRPR